MKYLLDTHTLLWFLKGDKKLSDKARRLIDSPQNKKFLSIASLWEITIKVSLGKLVLDKPFEKMFPEQLHFNRIEILDITVDSLIKLTTLPSSREKAPCFSWGMNPAIVYQTTA